MFFNSQPILTSYMYVYTCKDNDYNAYMAQ